MRTGTSGRVVTETSTTTRTTKEPQSVPARSTGAQVRCSGASTGHWCAGCAKTSFRGAARGVDLDLTRRVRVRDPAPSDREDRGWCDDGHQTTGSPSQSRSADPGTTVLDLALRGEGPNFLDAPNESCDAPRQPMTPCGTDRARESIALSCGNPRDTEG